MSLSKRHTLEFLKSIHDRRLSGEKWSDISKSLGLSSSRVAQLSKQYEYRSRRKMYPEWVRKYPEKFAHVMSKFKDKEDVINAINDGRIGMDGLKGNQWNFGKESINELCDILGIPRKYGVKERAWVPLKTNTITIERMIEYLNDRGYTVTKTHSPKLVWGWSDDSKRRDLSVID